MHPSSKKAVMTFAALSALFATPIVTDACFMRSPLPVQVWLDHINVEITDQVAVKTYNCTFKNANSQAVVGGTCYMELEPGAQVDDMSVLVDGKEMKAEILDVEKANQVFQDIVKQGGSPALLEYFGNQLIQTQVPRVAPNGTVTVKLTYTTVLKKKGDLIRLQMLNTNPKALMQPLKSAGVTVKIKSNDPIKNIYSPTHKVKIVEKPDWDVAVEWSQADYMPKHPFVLYYQVADDEVGASLIAHRELDEDGAFMLMLSPTIGGGSGAVTEEQILPKDVVFCVDTSGSMLEGKKMEQARAALKYCIESLRSGDRFNIVDFSTVPRQFSESGLVKLNDESQAKALKYVEKLHARGGTAIQESLSLSLKQLGRDDRLKMIVFATDGQPTIGERDPQKILKQMAEENQQDVRVFVFGEGYDVNTKLLDFLALDHRGEAEYILPEEDIAQKISRFFDRVGSPIMTDIKVSIDGLDVKEVFPRSIPDLFRGEQVIVYGRYNGYGAKTVNLTANIGGTQKSLEYSLDFPEFSEDDRNSFVPRLWAGKKVDYLLSELRMQPDPDKELVDEVTYLAMRYGIVTPYTSYLMADDIVAGGQTGAGGASGPVPLNAALPAAKAGRGVLRQQLLSRLSDAYAEDSASTTDGAKKRDRFEAARQLSELRSDAEGLDAYDKLLEHAYGDAGGKGTALAALRYIGSRTFYKVGDAWYDSVYDPEKHKDVNTVQVGSDEYFNLLKKHPRIAKYLALENVVFRIDETWYRFEKKSEE